MLKKLSFLMAVTSLTVGTSLSGTPTRSETERMYREIMREMTGREVSLARAAPDSATYITVGPFLFAPLAARDGFVFLYIEARILGEEINTLYSGVVYPHAIEEFQ